MPFPKNLFAIWYLLFVIFVITAFTTTLYYSTIPYIYIHIHTNTHTQTNKHTHLYRASTR
jgi:hypothetical protein